MFTTFVLPNQLIEKSSFFPQTIKLFELLISVSLPISIQILILMLGVQVHVRVEFLQFGLSSKQHL